MVRKHPAAGLRCQRFSVAVYFPARFFPLHWRFDHAFSQTNGATMLNPLTRNEHDLKIIREIAESGADRPVLMMNLNRYADVAGYLDGPLYKNYMWVLDSVLPHVGGKILWRSPIHGQSVGQQPIHEILAVWYPSHQAFLDLRNAPGSEENYRLRDETVEVAVIHRCDGEVAPRGS
jgi:hypothetical protein